MVVIVEGVMGNAKVYDIDTDKNIAYAGEALYEEIDAIFHCKFRNEYFEAKSRDEFEQVVKKRAKKEEIAIVDDEGLSLLMS